MRSIRKGLVRTETALGAGLVLLTLVSGCDLFTTKEASDNVAPNVDLALNEPIEGDTLFALVALHWDGGDPDGFVTRYQYRYRSRYCANATCTAGDTASTDWITTELTSDTIAFNSKAEVNRQIFQVRAIDNSGAASSPATRRFYTKRTSPPTTQIARPENGAQTFVLTKTTDWWPGVTLTYTGDDHDGEIVEFGWGVDDGPWHWTEDTTVVIPPEEFTQGGLSLNGEHTIQITARDNTDLLAHEGKGAARRSDTVRVTLVRPAFDRGILIIDETDEAANGSHIDAGDAAVDSFYVRLFEPDRVWDYQKNGGIPPRALLGRYNLIIWHADNYYASSSDAHKLPQHTEEIADYLNVGGDLIMSGWRILKSFVPDKNFPHVFKDTSFVNEYLHIVQADESGVPGKFTGAFGIDKSGFSDVSVSANKVGDSFQFPGKLGRINTIEDRKSFTETIYTYEGKSVNFRLHPAGIQYHGTAFDAVVLGFPVYFMKDEDATTLADEVLRSMNYR